MSRPKVRFHSAVKWATVMSWGQEGLSAVTTFVLALILGPNDFGTVILALAFIGLIELFAQQGFHGSIVQRPECTDEDLDTVFWITLGLGAVLTVAGFAAASVIASAYELPELAPLMQVSSAAVILRSLTVVQEAKLTREMAFRPLAIRTNVSVVAGAIAGISIAVAGGGAWALVGQYLARSAAGLVILWRSAGWIPSLRFHPGRAREMSIFSAKFFPSSLFDYFGSQAEPMIIGSFFGPAAVGIYRLSIRIVDLAVLMVTRALWYVSFPYFSEAKGDVDTLRIRVKECLRFASLFSLPLLSIVAMESPALTEVLGHEWSEAAPVIRILCIYGTLRGLTLFAGPLLFATGRPQAHSMLVGFQCAALCAAAYTVGVLMQNDASGAQTIGIAWARVIVYVSVFLPFALFIMVRIAATPMLELLRVLIPGAIVTIVAVGTHVALVPLSGGHGAAGLIARVTISGLAALAAVALLHQDTAKAVVYRVFRRSELA